MAPSPVLPAPRPDEPAADAAAWRWARGIACGALAGRTARTFVLLGALLASTAFAATDGDASLDDDEDDAGDDDAIEAAAAVAAAAAAAGCGSGRRGRRAWPGGGWRLTSR